MGGGSRRGERSKEANYHLTWCVTAVEVLLNKTDTTVMSRPKPHDKTETKLIFYGGGGGNSKQTQEIKLKNLQHLSILERLSP